ncbi:lipid A deacylase LpxR family protein [Desulfurivibrio sp. C05AmB]|uniref:lipid A deacylase LpxR family protein n=1 Tax=Desulfurivibrio sp. C05AmB TaxID=3374371 RepID=UPI00376ECBF8
MKKFGFIIGLILAALPLPGLAGQEAPDGAIIVKDSPGIFTVVVENDTLLGTDRHFTHGSRFSYYSGKIRNDWLNRLAELAPFVPRSGPDQLWRASTALGHNIYTPADITVSELQTEERPYAGYLYLGFGLVRVTETPATGRGIVDSFELQTGVVGPAALARPIQTWWHANVSSSPEPMGWEHQLRNEPILNLYWDRQWRYPLIAGQWVDTDLIPHTGLALGNADIHLGSGFTVRLGKRLADDNGPPRIRPSLPGAGYFRKNPTLGGYLFVGGEARLVGRNIFLDGNTFRDSHSVSRRVVAFDVQYGFVVSYRSFKLALTNIIRGREFSGQSSPDHFSALGISWQR